MPPVRLKALTPVIAIALIAFFFWAVDRYDRAALTRFTHPLDRLSPSSLRGQGHGSDSSNGKGKGKNKNSDNTGPAQLNFQNLRKPNTPHQLCASARHPNPPHSPPPSLTFSEWLIGKNYTRAYFRPRHVSPDTTFSSMETIDHPVLQPFRPLGRGMRVQLSPPVDPRDPDSDSDSDPWPCPHVVDVDVAADHAIDETSNLLFGLATTVDRLRRLLPALLYSYGRSKASLLVLVPGDTKDIEEHEAYFRNAGLDITLQKSPLPFTARYFGLVEGFTDFIKTTRPNTTWVSFVDDDTFFLSLASIAKQLSTFNASERVYIGALSEASWQVDTFGQIGFGGAGVFVSVPLLERLHGAYDTCQSWGEQPGDQKLAQCIDKFGDTPLTLWDTLYQMDMKGAVDGVYESGRQIHSLHHWGSWYKKDVVKMSTVAAAAGRQSVLRRFRFDEFTTLDSATGASMRSFWVLTNGYSLVRYTMDARLPSHAVNFNHTEKTWDEDQRGYEKRLGPLRPKDQPGIRKERWMLADSVVVGDNVHQTYVNDADGVHSVIELVWLGPAGGGGAF
ncbi:conserved hypothetical protein [Histoplasma capsulatum G186AR]|uniref:Fringe-like glycosyltransferase domain-containing protein n=2 Tax=Ajellomyces capsulatus TaxID=5037 RepID=C0NRK6_AJECG|nr:uncharacterized protein HCBG_05636 [Histoplasma capsulatum G186AR]EEH06320.1 conserved hypothetical protein [Histoplasma capsulatum G186AR]KAG5293224.1 glucosaminyltransferase domain-containing protein [Histoplasma capsulatum]QSS74674.1 glucosaminyltransferase domain-containing protein [Histoplasma capsulatum G186AR]